MRLAKISIGDQLGIATATDGGLRAILGDPALADLDALFREGPDVLFEVQQDIAKEGLAVAEGEISFLPPLVRSSKILCVGLNYREHADEAEMAVPDFPSVFARFGSGLIGHGRNLVKPRASDQFDYEGELAVLIGEAGSDIAVAEALTHVGAYSVFNDGSVRDYQLKTTQWTLGKNFDATGAFGPWLVTPEEVPPGAHGLSIVTRLNGEVMQSASTSDLIFDVAHLISLLSTCMTLEVGDVILTGTPAGIGMTRTPPRYMREGDVCEIEIESIGCLRNAVVDG